MLRQRNLLLVCALLFLSLVCASHAKQLSSVATLDDQKAHLQQIAYNLKSTGNFNSTTVGPVFSELNSAFHATNLPLTNPIMEILENPLRLEVNATTLVWFQRTAAEFIIYYDASDNLQVGLFFDTIISLDTTWELIFYKAAPSWLTGINGTDSSKVGFNSGSQSWISIPRGLTLLGQATVTPQSSWKKVFDVLHSENSDITANLFIPTYSSDASQSSTLSLTDAKIITLTSDLEVTGFAVNYCGNCEQTSTVSGHFRYFPENANPATLELSGIYSEEENSLDLSGSLSTHWAPLGLKWFTFTEAATKLSLSVEPISLVAFAIEGSAITTIDPSTPITALFSINGTGFADALLQISDIPFSVEPFNLRAIWDTITNQNETKTYPTLLDEVRVYGKGQIAITSYSSESFSRGLTLQIAAGLTADAKVLIEPLKVFNSTATSKTYDFGLSLNVPFFDLQSESITFGLQETTPVDIGNNLEIQGFGVQVSYLTNVYPTIQLTSAFGVYFGEKSTTTPVVFDVAAQIQGITTPLTAFTGTLSSPWVNPFGIDWLTFESADVGFNLAGTDLQSLTFDGSVSLSFLNGPPVDGTLEFGESLNQWYFQLSDIDFSDFYSVYKIITGLELPSEIDGIQVTGSGSLALSNYDLGQGPAGLTIAANVNLAADSVVHGFARYIVNENQPVNFDLSLFVPVFSATPQNILVKFAENDPIQVLRNTFICESFQIQVKVDVPNIPQFQLGAVFQLNLKHNIAPISLRLNSDWVSPQDASISLAAEMPLNWVDPFGVKWMTLTEITGSITLAVAGIENVELAGLATLHFSNTSSGAVSARLDFDDNFMEAVVTVTLDNLWTIGEIASTVLLGEPLPSSLDDLTFLQETDLTVKLNTEMGVTVTATANIQNAIMNHLTRSAYFYANSSLWGPDSNFAVSLSVPLFTRDPSALSVAFAIHDNISLTPDITLMQVAFTIHLETLAVSLSTSVLGHFKRNPDLRFDFAGTFNPDGSVLVEGDMWGTWDNAFGFKGFNLSNVIGQLGLNPSMCQLDGCISDLGVGAGLAFGNYSLTFDGNAAIPDFTDIYLAGSTAFPINIKDISEVWNRINPEHPVDIASLPSDWGMVDASFYLAPEDGTFGPITYSAGFGITGMLTVLEMELYASVNCTLDSISCAFGFDVGISKEQFAELIRKELTHPFGSRSEAGFDFFSIDDVSLSDWSQKRVADGLDPRWVISLTILDAKHHLDFRVPQWSLASSFHDFFQQWMAHLFVGAQPQHAAVVA
eukprot:TRINITY_DN1756_c0_g1_i1.p1 TRINITY_DN1756_c0_g1~~TRINITY_DN1756_c0_g1_i1.p1  ORF type:complete len:1266 (+),score=271.82 TRINITY_DN1756_c0_g1_i1:192-3989(+)